ncbi:MAG: DUF3800 domain-containing protein [Actinomycetota bacterium]|nr:DUF3800 domain-containing protein [Actinomycetota bacterium]
MHLLFLDESGKPDDRAFALGGIAVRAAEWSELRAAWEAALTEAGWPLDKELKWHGTRSGEVPPDVADLVFARLAHAPITCFVSVLHPLAGKTTHPKLFATPEATYSTALTFLAERFERHLKRADSYGAVVLDSRERDADDGMRRFFDRVQRQGTQFMKLERIVDSLLLGPSHHSIGLQVADLVVGAALAAQRGQGDGSRWHKQLLPRFARHPDSGEVEGVGLKVFPDKVRAEEPPSSKLFELN